ncbi:MAG: HNH endonuclease [Cetobacterium sp.]
MKNELFNELLEIFPNNILKDFSKKMLYENRKKFEIELKNEMKEGITLKQILINKYGFIDGSSNLFDYKLIEILSEEYEGKGNYTRKIFAKIEGVSKQRIEQKLKKTLKKKIILNWNIEKLDDFEELVFLELIKLKKFEIEKENIWFFIIQNMKECLILIYDKINKQYKTITDKNNYYIQELAKNNFHKYNENDFINIEYLKNHNINGVAQVTTKDLKNSNNKKNMLSEKYIEFLGYKYMHPNKYYTDDKIKMILNKYIYPGTEKDIYIPTDSEDAQLLRMLGNRYDHGIEELITRLGYNYHIRDAYLRSLKTLEHFANSRQEIWLPAIGTFYHILCSHAHRKEFLLEEYIIKLGFIKIESKIQVESEEERSKKIDEYYESLKIQRTVVNYQLDQESLQFIEEVESGLENIERINEKEALVKQRLTQGVFRENLLKKECKCKICDIKDKVFLIASHIKPWTESDNKEKIDVNNGFLFCPNHDKLFDKGYISFENSGKIKISKIFTEDDLKKFNLS